MKIASLLASVAIFALTTTAYSAVDSPRNQAASILAVVGFTSAYCPGLTPNADRFGAMIDATHADFDTDRDAIMRIAKQAVANMHSEGSDAEKCAKIAIHLGSMFEQ